MQDRLSIRMGNIDSKSVQDEQKKKEGEGMKKKTCMQSTKKPHGTVLETEISVLLLLPSLVWVIPDLLLHQ